MYIYTTIAALVAGYVLDLCIGDPHGMWHPICFVGNLISFFEKRLRRGRSERADLAGGVLLVILVTGISTAIPFGILFLCYRLWFWLGFAVEVYMCYTVLATKSLKTESMKVAEALEQEGLEAGRYAVSMIVGRDTKELTETGVVKAAVETVAENTSDGILAPMFYMVIGGPVLGYFYKAVNTMDSMVGYKNDKFLYFGRAAAKFDDVMNFLPSRISGILMVLAAPLVKLDGKNAWKIFKRDRLCHASPNSAQTESVMAGALQVQLAGDAWYFGKKHEKPTIGDPIRPVEIADIARANRLLYAASALGIQELLKHNGISSTICYKGKIDRYSTDKLRELMEIELLNVEDLSTILTDEDEVILVDAQKGNSNIVDITGDEIICIDHHPENEKFPYRFKDIRPEVGACATIVAQYFFENNIPMDRRIATTLTYGVRIDTNNLSRGVSKLDIEMLYRMFDECDYEVIHMLENSNLCFDDLMAYSSAISSIEVYDDISFCNTGKDCPVIANISDFMLALKEVSFSVVYSRKSDGIKLSVRSEKSMLDAGKIVAEALKGIGNGGGHASMAGGFVPCTGSDMDVKLLEAQMKERFLNVIADVKKRAL